MTQQTYTFQAEIQQLLDILVHSLYTEREIFLRELVSNASDALHRIQFEMLTNREVNDPDVDLHIDIAVAVDFFIQNGQQSVLDSRAGFPDFIQENDICTR